MTGATLDGRVAQEKYQSTYPSNLHFGWSWDQSKAKALGVRQIWDHGFTYIQSKFEEPPLAYELKDKKGSLINFQFETASTPYPSSCSPMMRILYSEKSGYKRVSELPALPSDEIAIGDTVGRWHLWSE